MEAIRSRFDPAEDYTGAAFDVVAFDACKMANLEALVLEDAWISAEISRNCFPGSSCTGVSSWRLTIPGWQGDKPLKGVLPGNRSLLPW